MARNSVHQKVAKAIGRNVRKARQGAGLSGIQLAKKLGIKPTSFCPYLSKLENGHTMPKVTTLRALAKVLKVKPEQLAA